MTDEGDSGDDQVADSVAQTNSAVLGSAPAMGQAASYQALAHATASLFQSASGAQSAGAISGQGAINQGVFQMYAINSAASAVVTKKLAHATLPTEVLNQGAVERGLKNAKKSE